tara:strand:+ start:973 stop:1506 length:534 start_codon:yes stop_codon:yes gene_type:complete
METSTKSKAINLGLILGAILASITLISYAVYLELLTKWWLGIFLFIVIICFGIISVSKAKKLNDGFIEFKEAFSSYFITIAIGIIISTATSILIFNVLDQEAAMQLKEMTIDATVKMMKGFNAPAESISQTVDAMEEQKNQYSIGPQLQSTAIFLVIQSIIGLIIALIMKKPKENQI